MATYEGPSEGPSPDALRSLSTLVREVFADPDARQQFVDDPSARLGALDLPENVASFFKGLSHDELGLIADMCEEMTRAGLVYQIDDGKGGTMCFL